MTTTAQVRQVLNPLLSRHSDLALVGRFLIIKPVHHIVRGVFVDRCGNPNEFVPTKVVDILLPNRTMFTLGWGGRLYKAPYRIWDANNADAVSIMREMIEHEVLPELRKITSFDDFVAVASEKRPLRERVGYEAFTYEHMLLAIAHGDFDKAREIWDSDPKISRYMKSKNPSFYPALLNNDRSALAGFLHQWEAQTIETYKLEKFWEPTPFPLELEEGR
ncbi:hypothetical protein [Phyllobacterium myrsinacearum]|uniref:Uncharacterized protein n=1 Tax=Phyllobacterium myrsinacearum TaxID=28101 RepID=A0A839ED90_9HYPH|nr:hypothetical protein [Phyllobacterium myrsinacearum]MBA8876902.1 hypothetical protein [Phyllobacterium myrsinacearum]